MWGADGSNGFLRWLTFFTRFRGEDDFFRTDPVVSEEDRAQALPAVHVMNKVANS